MMSITSTKIQEFSENGFAIIKDVFIDSEIQAILEKVESADTTNPTFRVSKDVFAIRQFLKEVPASASLIFSDRLTRLIESIREGCFVVKSIYFDKPADANWFVSYHQDLTISVNKKINIEGYGPWSTKQNQFAVQPPLRILENNFTVRIHLDDTDENNGALRVIPTSHLKGVYRPETIDWRIEKEIVCNVPRGGVMIMRPLLLHASGRTTNHHKRRVIHIEFSRELLSAPLEWSEYAEINKLRSAEAVL
jgi:hypothetical protein